VRIERLARLSLGILIVARFILPPLVCSAVDDHIFPRPDCPYCNLTMVFLVAPVGAFLVFVLILAFLRRWLEGAALLLWRLMTGGLPSARDPPISHAS